MPTAVLTTVLAASPIVSGERGIILHSSTFVILSAVPYFPWTAAPHDARYLSAAVFYYWLVSFDHRRSVIARTASCPRGAAHRALSFDVRLTTAPLAPLSIQISGESYYPRSLPSIINTDASAMCYSTCYGCSARCLDGLTMVRPHRILAVGLPESAPPFVPSVAAARGFCSDFRLTYLLILA